MSAPAVNGNTYPTTEGVDVHAHAHPRKSPQTPAQAPGSDRNPMRTRAISRDWFRCQAHRVGNFLQPHGIELASALTDGWAVSYAPPSVSEAARKLAPPAGTRWFLWPVDALANLLVLAVLLIAWLFLNAVATPPRRRAGLLLLAAAIATTVTARVLTGH